MAREYKLFFTKGGKYRGSKELALIWNQAAIDGFKEKIPSLFKGDWYHDIESFLIELNVKEGTVELLKEWQRNSEDMIEIARIKDILRYLIEFNDCRIFMG